MLYSIIRLGFNIAQYLFVTGILCGAFYCLLFFYSNSTATALFFEIETVTFSFMERLMVQLCAQLIIIATSTWVLAWGFFLIGSRFNESLKQNFMLHMLASTKIPAMYFVSPSIEALTEDSCAIKIPLSSQTKNHLDSMYFGVLMIGADIAGGLMAMNHINKAKAKVSLVFKDCFADFHQRAEGDVIFECHDGPVIHQKVRETIQSGERINIPVTVEAKVPESLDDKPVATFKLTLSLKCKK